jgi:hypothetical protein
MFVEAVIGNFTEEYEINPEVPSFFGFPPLNA